MSAARRRFSQDFKDALCREVIDTPRPIAEVAKSYGVGAESLRRWFIKYREDNGGGQEELSLPGAGPVEGVGTGESGAAG
ncbi:hypothetical protein GCM10027402_25470 [Arthrobacter monumenti]